MAQRHGTLIRCRIGTAIFATMAEPKVRKRKQVLKKLRSKYRLVLINDANFAERFSIRLSRMNVILLFLGLFTVHGLFVSALIVLTPLKRFIPGYTDQAM
jgi:hypothetical protein